MVLVGVLLAGCSERSTEPSFTLTQVGPDIWAAIDNPNASSRAVANAGFVVGDDGVAVIDTLGTAEAAPQLLTAIRTLTNLPIRFVINTHYHLDHVAGNRVFADAGAIVMAQRNVRDWVHTETIRTFGPNITPDLKALTDAVVAPMMVYDKDADVYLGSRQIQIRSFPGHTGGDSIVLIPDAEVAFAGDLLAHDVLPSLGDASTNQWIDTLDMLLADKPDHIFVPGHGHPGKADDVAAFREYLKTLRALVAEAQATGKSGEALVETVVPVLRRRYGQWEFFDAKAKANVLETAAELSGTKRIPQVARWRAIE